MDEIYLLVKHDTTADEFQVFLKLVLSSTPYSLPLGAFGNLYTALRVACPIAEAFLGTSIGGRVKYQTDSGNPVEAGADTP